jgi:hypothetical protein
MRNRAKQLAFATVVLVVAIAGAAMAAGSITGKSIKDGSITGKDIKNHSITKTDLKGNFTGPQGVQGPPGPQGPAGPAGPAGALGATVVEASEVVQPGDIGGPQAFCPAGTGVVGTGFFASITYVGFVEAFGNSVGAAFENDSTIPVDTRVQAICAVGGSTNGGGVSRAAARGGGRSAERADFEEATRAYAQLKQG